MGDMPLMTSNGTFVINGTERVIVSQMHRSPGVFFDHDRGRTHASGKLLFAARIIPTAAPGSTSSSTPRTSSMYVSTVRRKLPVTTLLYALGLDDEEILSTFYRHIMIKESKRGWKMPFTPEKMRGMTPLSDLMDARTGDLVAKAGEKITAARRVNSPKAVSRKSSFRPRISLAATSPKTSSISTRAASTPRPAPSSMRSCSPRSRIRRSRNSRSSTSTMSTSVRSSATRSTSTRTRMGRKR